MIEEVAAAMQGILQPSKALKRWRNKGLCSFISSVLKALTRMPEPAVLPAALLA
jgi:hypothetical protein